MCILNRVLIAATLVVLATASAHAATFTVTNTNDSGPGSLGEAILAANANSGTDLIAFNIPGSGPHTIQPAQLPTITDPVVIDGYSQPGASTNSNPPESGTNAVLLIELDGSLASCCFGIALNTANSIVQGLVINRFPNKGLIVLGLGGGGNVIQGNFIGTDVTGTIALGNSSGGVELDTAGNTIGGTTVAARNLISGNRARGIDLISSGNIIQGNLIGTDATGTVSLGNTTASGGPPAFPGDGAGVDTNSVGNTMIGGTTLGAGNIISGNSGSGIFLANASITDNIVEGNFIGTDVSGITALGNDGDGILLRASTVQNLSAP